MKTSRRKFSSEFKSKVCVEAIHEQQTINFLQRARQAISNNKYYLQ